MGAQRGVSKGMEDAGHPSYGRATPEMVIRLFQGVAYSQGVEEWGLAGPSDMLGRSWPPHAIYL
jgi:hypothetical protein